MSGSQASRLDPKLPLALYGLAQIMVRQREPTNAISLLESALAQVPGWPDALHMVGHLYPQAERKGQAAIAHFRDATEANSKSASVWEMLGELLAPIDAPGQPSSSPRHHACLHRPLSPVTQEESIVRFHHTSART